MPKPIGISPEQQIANVQKEHERDFAGFKVDFDHYDSTNSPENQARVLRFILKTVKRTTLRYVL